MNDGELSDHPAWERALRVSALSPNAKLVAWTLASHFNWSAGARTYVSQKTLATETGLHRTTVVYALRELAESGAIDVITRGGGLGARRDDATEYQRGTAIRPAAGPLPRDRHRRPREAAGQGALFGVAQPDHVALGNTISPVGNAEDANDANTRKPPDHVAQGNTVQEPDHVAPGNRTMLPRATPTVPLNSETSLRDVSNPARAPRSLDSDQPALGFDDFWAIYPRRVGKIKAREAWARALKHADPRMIVNGARRFRDDPNREARYTAHPTTWLNRGSWDDDPLPPRDAGHDRRDQAALAFLARSASRRAADVSREDTTDERPGDRRAVAPHRRQLPGPAR